MCRWLSLLRRRGLRVFGVPDGVRAVPLAEPAHTHAIGVVLADRQPGSMLARAFLEVAKERGFAEVTDHNDPTQSGVGPQPTNGTEGIRVSTAIGYLHPIRQRPNLTIRPQCLANRVVFEGRRAVGVEVACDGQIEEVRGRRITLSAGAVASPAILLRSGIGPPDHRT